MALAIQRKYQKEVMTIMHVANHLLDDRLRPPVVLSGVFIHLLYVVVSTSRESQDKDPKKRGANCAAIGMRKIRTPKIANTSLEISLPGLLRLGNQLLKHTPNSHNSLKLPPCKQLLLYRCFKHVYKSPKKWPIRGPVLLILRTIWIKPSASKRILQIWHTNTH